MNNVNVGEKIKKYRKDRGITQKELAEAVGVTQAMIAYIESDLKMPSVNILFNIAKELNVSVDSLTTV
jgi:transcriptional regulator with XRE-family HTH domain|nr:MAG TPA: helix-turn-helix domain protein [Caudoviricetes sp.]